MGAVDRDVIGSTNAAAVVVEVAELGSIVVDGFGADLSEASEVSPAYGFSSSDGIVF